MTIVAVALGGALGSVARYLIAVRLYKTLGLGLPYGTLTVNVVGSMLLGIVLALVEERGILTPEQRSFVTIGFLGGMTTFSTFIYEGWDYTRDGDLMRAGLYAAVSLIGAFAAFSLAHAATRAVAA
jgi:CrcB protein